MPPISAPALVASQDSRGYRVNGAAWCGQLTKGGPEGLSAGMRMLTLDFLVSVSQEPYTFFVRFIFNSP